MEIARKQSQLNEANFKRLVFRKGSPYLKEASSQAVVMEDNLRESVSRLAIPKTRDSLRIHSNDKSV